MYSKEQREKALALYDKCHSVTKVMQSLGYPESRAGLYLWLKQRNALPKKKAERKQINNAPNHPLHPSLETKLAICILRAPAVADALTTGRGAVIERSAGGAGQDCL